MEGDDPLEGNRVNKEPVSVRQLALAALTGGIAPAAAAAAYGWQGTALAIPFVLLAGGISTALAPRWSAVEGRLPGYILKVCYAFFGVLLLARGLSRSAARLAYTGGGGESTKLWLMVILAVPLIWMSYGKTGAYFRTAEICFLAVTVVTLVVLVWAGFRMDWRYLIWQPVSLVGGLLAAVESAGLFLFAIPYIYKEGLHPGDGGRAISWLLALSVGTTLLALAAAGVLSPAVLPLTQEPFFTMAAALGKSIRVEGLVSALWILSDVVYLGFLSRSWHRTGKERDWLPAAAIILGGICAAFGLLNRLPEMVFGVGTVVLWGISALVLWLGGKK